MLSSLLVTSFQSHAWFLCFCCATLGESVIFQGFSIKPFFPDFSCFCSIFQVCTSSLDCTFAQMFSFEVGVRSNFEYCGEHMITLSLPRSGTCNLAILNCAPVFAPRLLRCACGLVMQYCNVFFSEVFPPWEAFDQLRCCVCFSFIPRLFSSMIERCP